MKKATSRQAISTQANPKSLPKAPTGIDGLDEITGGGLPQGRPTLICGSAGCGKTLLAMEFLVRGATKYGAPGVFMSFEETAEELAQNVRSLGFDVNDLLKRNMLAVDYVRVVKYRGSTHGTNEYPFLIDEDGISVLPITSAGLRHEVSKERMSSGIPRLDAMLGGAGYYRGSSILVSGTAGSGKSSLAAHFIDAACARGEKCLYFAFEESPSQVIRNMRSIGFDLEKWEKKGLLQFHAMRSTMYGLEMHLASIHKLIKDFQPQVFVADPVGSLLHAGNQQDATAMLTRLIDFLKLKNITAFLTSLTSASIPQESTEVDISSLVDTWVLLRDFEAGGERNRALYILKSRGMSHSNQLREFLLTDQGIELLDVYVGPEGVLTGSLRLSQEARENAEALAHQEAVEARLRERDRRREALEARIAALRKEFDAEEYEAQHELEIAQRRAEVVRSDRGRMAVSRRADAVKPAAGSVSLTGTTRGQRK